MKKVLLVLVLLGLAAGGGYMAFKKNTFSSSAPPIISPDVSKPPSQPTPVAPPSADRIAEDLLRHLDTTDLSDHPREMPLPVATDPAPPIAPPPARTPDKRAAGREQRKLLPLGVVLWDDAPIYDAPSRGQVLYRMHTGDFVKVYATESPGRYHVHPGVDIYLAATSKAIETAGNRFPDVDGWIDRQNLHIFPPEEAKEFTQDTDPVTLGAGPDFSTVEFYRRALRNEDPVVHRVIGPRFIELLSIHEDYLPEWSALFRDPDAKIRSVTLAALRERGVGNSREIIEDMIRRLAELTRRRAEREDEAEVLSILAILEKSGHPRVPTALESFRDSWEKTQSAAVQNALRDILSDGR